MIPFLAFFWGWLLLVAPTGAAFLEGASRYTAAADFEHVVLVSDTARLVVWERGQRTPAGTWSIPRACERIQATPLGFVCEGAPPVLVWRIAEGELEEQLSVDDDQLDEGLLYRTPSGQLRLFRADGTVNDAGWRRIPAEDGDRIHLEVGAKRRRGVRNPTSVHLHPGGRWLAVASALARVEIRDTREDALVALLELHEPMDTGEREAATGYRTANLQGAWFLGEDQLWVALAGLELRRFSLLDARLPVPLAAQRVFLGGWTSAPALGGGSRVALLCQGRDFPPLRLDARDARPLPEVAPCLAAVSDAEASNRFLVVTAEGELRTVVLDLEADSAAAEGAESAFELEDERVRAVARELPAGAEISTDFHEEDVVPLLDLVDEHIVFANRNTLMASSSLEQARFLLDKANRVAPNLERSARLRGKLQEAEQRYTKHLITTDVLGSLTLFLVGLGLARTHWRRRERQRVLFNRHNPFREDSPHRADRTPFAMHGFVDEVLRNVGRNNIALVAPELAGKSAFLRHIAHRLRTEGLRGSEVVVVEVELRDVEESQFWGRLAQSIRSALEAAGASTEGLKVEDASPTRLVRFFRRWPRCEKAAGREPRAFVLVVHDFGVLGDFARENQRFRNLLQMVPSSTVSIVGGARNLKVDVDRYASPWHNYLLVHELRPLAVQEIRQYLRSRLKAPFEMADDVPDMLYELTRGRPLQVWHFAYRMVEEALFQQTTRLTAAHVLAAQETVQSVVRNSLALGGDPEENYRRTLERVAVLKELRQELLDTLEERTRAAAVGATPGSSWYEFLEE